MVTYTSSPSVFGNASDLESKEKKKEKIESEELKKKEKNGPVRNLKIKGRHSDNNGAI